MQARERMAGPEDMPEQAVTVKIAGEEIDAAPPEAPSVGPSRPARLGLAWRAADGRGGDIGARVGAAEKAEEALESGNSKRRRS